MHPYQYTLELLKQTIAKAPKFFSAERRAAMEAEAGRLAADVSATRDAIEARIIEYGREIWPYRKAFDRIHDSEGRPREREFMSAALPDALRSKLDAYLHGGGSIEEVRGGGEFETFFTPEEKVAILEAKISAHHRVAEEIDSLCVGEKKTACDAHLGEYRRAQQEIESLIKSLRELSAASGKWQAEITDKVRVFELGWAGVEREVRAEDVRGEIDFYHGVIEETEAVR